MRADLGSEEIFTGMCARVGSNHRPSEPQSDALIQLSYGRLENRNSVYHQGSKSAKSEAEKGMTRIFALLALGALPLGAFVPSFSKTHLKAGALVALRLDLAPGDGEVEVSVNGRPVYPKPHPGADVDVRLLYLGVDLENPPEKMEWRLRSPRKELRLTMAVEGPARTAQGVVNLGAAGKATLLTDYQALLRENQFFLDFFKRPPGLVFFGRGPFVTPVLERLVSSPFGRLRVYDNGARSYHRGVDFPFDEGVQVVASGRGRVSFSGSTRIRGEMVVVDHGLGLSTSYWHLSKRKVQEGEWVESGDTVGAVGTTGMSTGPHLHFECRLGDMLVNGLDLLDLPPIFTP